jgi:hypothetical protein
MASLTESTNNGNAAPVNQLQVIKQIVKPTMVLDDIVVQDLESGESNTGANTGGREYPIKYTNAVAAESPMFQINEVIYKDRDIDTMTISNSGFLPTISVSLLVRGKFTYSKSFPKDGDLISVFLRSKDDSLKPIRNDYEITSVEVDASTEELGIDTMRINGILNVPGLPAQKCFVKKGNSIDILQNIAEEYSLGFATNEISTKDEQKWICPYKRPIDFIKEVSRSSWKDDKSFFTSFIDIYYHLNFVNVEPMFSAKPGFEKGLNIENFSSDYDIDSETFMNLQGIIFTNHSSAEHSQFRVVKYQQVNLANSKNRQEGYMKYMHYYDGLLREKNTIFSDPIVSEGASESQFTFKGRNADNTQRYVQVTHRWMGTIYGTNGENCHSKYLYAQTWNHQNNVHLDKLYLEMELEGVNMNIRRYQTIPVVITIQDDIQRRQANPPEDPTNTSAPQPSESANKTAESMDHDTIPFVIDKFYTGFYVVDEIDYIYENGKIRQKMKLLRREWPAPPQP